MKNAIALLPLVALSACYVYADDVNRPQPPSNPPPVIVDNYAPEVLDAFAGVFWDGYVVDDIWSFEATVDDLDGPARHQSPNRLPVAGIHKGDVSSREPIEIVPSRRHRRHWRPRRPVRRRRRPRSETRRPRNNTIPEPPRRLSRPEARR